VLSTSCFLTSNAREECTALLSEVRLLLGRKILAATELTALLVRLDLDLTGDEVACLVGIA
jgi:hypothetical protein